MKNFSLVILFSALSLFAEEGMFPISEISTLNLNEKGLRIPVSEVFNADSVSLIHGICKVGGCTGSFISKDGLILTNHHCAFEAAQSASTPEQDFVKDGFLAKTRSEEIEAREFTVRITKSYRDVSDSVLSAIRPEMPYKEQSRSIEHRMKELVKQEEDINPDMRAEIAEMFQGKTYVLFLYTYLKDVRLVYIPPRSVGEFGGETDNWMWPRHNGDFALMRVYTAPDGGPSDYNTANVPFHPEKVLHVEPEGVSEGDFVFILGYPYRTFRHRTSHYVDYELNVRMPWVADLYDWQIETMKTTGIGDREVAIKHLSKIKSRSNVMKNYHGKFQGLEHIGWLNAKRNEETELSNFINTDSARYEKYGHILSGIDSVYKKITGQAPRTLILDYLRRSVQNLNYACTVYEAAVERQKPDLDRLSPYMDRNFDRTRQQVLNALKEYDEPTDQLFFVDMLARADALSDSMKIPAFESLKNSNRNLAKLYGKSKAADESWISAAFEMTPEELSRLGDPFVKLAITLYPEYEALREIRREQNGALDQLYAALLDVKQEWLGARFIPDANSTLRLTYGQIRGYSPADAVRHLPFTTLNGILEKNTGEEPFDAPEDLIQLIRNDPDACQVCMLYDMDTTGGNSGSAVLDAHGHIVGLNFDRTFQATINDYAWNTDYSRSIGVDIRYLIWILKQYSKADHLLREMGIE